MSTTCATCETIATQNAKFHYFCPNLHVILKSTSNRDEQEQEFITMKCIDENSCEITCKNCYKDHKPTPICQECMQCDIHDGMSPETIVQILNREHNLRVERLVNPTHVSVHWNSIKKISKGNITDCLEIPNSKLEYIFLIDNKELLLPNGIQFDLKELLMKIVKVDSSKIDLPLKMLVSGNGKYLVVYHEVDAMVIHLQSFKTFFYKRSNYHAGQTPYPLQFFEMDGKVYLIHGVEYNQLQITDLEKNEDIHKEFMNRQADDLFWGKLTISPNQRWILSSCWRWAPYGSIQFFQLPHAFESPIWMDCSQTLFMDVEWNLPVTWIDGNRCAILTSSMVLHIVDLNDEDPICTYNMRFCFLDWKSSNLCLLYDQIMVYGNAKNGYRNNMFSTNGYETILTNSPPIVKHFEGSNRFLVDRGENGMEIIEFRGKLEILQMRPDLFFSFK